MHFNLWINEVSNDEMWKKSVAKCVHVNYSSVYLFWRTVDALFTAEDITNFIYVPLKAGTITAR